MTLTVFKVPTTSTMNAIIQCRYTYKYMGVVGSLGKKMQVW